MRKYTKLFFKFVFIFYLGAFSFLHNTFAAEVAGQCSQKGYTITTINGVFTDEKGARENKDNLKKKLPEIYKNEKLTIDFLLNPSHLGGIGDILKSAYQGIFDKEKVEDYDLTEMIKAASEKIQTQKLLIVAHSQGNFYANSFYDSVAGKSGGVPTESIGVYSVATPASRVAGGGRWLTSDTDKVIAGVVGRVPFKKIMEPNTHIELKDGDDALGHNFTNVYLKYRGGQIVSDIKSSLDKLKTNDVQGDNNLCIASPKISIIHKTEKVMFAVADPVANVGVSAAVGTVSGTYRAGKFTVNTIKKAAQKTAEVAKAAVQKTTAAIKNVFTDQKVDSMANIANIGQIATQTQSVAVEPSAEVQTLSENQFVDIEPKSIEAEPLDPKEVQPQNTELTQIQSKEAEPPAQKEVQPPIHSPYQWPEESAQGSSSTSSENKLSSLTSGSITNQFQGQFNGSYSSPADQDSTKEEIASPLVGQEARNDENENAAPEAPQEQSQNQIDGDSTSGDLEVESPTEPPASEEDSSPEAQNDTQPEQIVDETPAEPEPSQPEPEPQPTTPDIQFYLTNYNVRQMNFTLNWQDANNIIQNWELEYRLGPNFGWEILRSAQNDTGAENQNNNSENSYQFTAQYDDLTYYFHLRGQDANGNWTDWKTLQADISTNPVAINEIAWMGTIASSTDEWIELANKTDQEIDLSGWTLRESDGEPAITLTGKIAPNGFYLLERTNDDTIRNISADQIYAGALNDPRNQQDYGQEFILTDKEGNIIDKTKVAYSGQSNSNARIKISSERVSMWADGDNRDNWQYYWSSYLTVLNDAKDAGGNAISGTPKSKNSWADRIFSISTDIAKNTTLLKDRGMVKVLNNINISGATLNIESGTVLKFSGGQSGFNVISGSILAKGAAENKIVFTSTNDNTYGIQTGYSSSMPGDWGKINFGENTTGEFYNIIFRYSGAGTANPSIKGFKSSIKISNSYFDNNKYDILSVENSDIDISLNTFKNNNHNGITISEGTSNITGNIIDWLANPGVGIHIKSQKGTVNISNNQFSAMIAPIMTDYLGNFTIHGNQISGTNSYNGILVNSSSGYAYDEEIYLDSDTVYFMTSSVYYMGPKLKISPGTIIKFSGGLYVQGDFEAIGTAEKPIVFTKIGDDSVGGASGSNGGSSPPAQWRTLQVSGAANVAMDYFTIKYGGNWSFGDKCIKIFDGVQNFSFTNSTMTQCGRGLYSYTDNAQIENSVFSANSFNLESYAQTGHISNTTFGDTLVESLTLSDYQQVNY